VGDDAPPLEVLPIYSLLSADLQAKIFLPTHDNRRKVLPPCPIPPPPPSITRPLPTRISHIPHPPSPIPHHTSLLPLTPGHHRHQHRRNFTHPRRRQIRHRLRLLQTQSLQPQDGAGRARTHPHLMRQRKPAQGEGGSHGPRHLLETVSRRHPFPSVIPALVVAVFGVIAVSQVHRALL